MDTVEITLGPVATDEFTVRLPDGTDVTEKLGVRRVEIVGEAGDLSIARLEIYCKAKTKVPVRHEEVQSGDYVRIGDRQLIVMEIEDDWVTLGCGGKTFGLHRETLEKIRC